MPATLLLLGLLGVLWLGTAQPTIAQAVDGPLERQHVRDYIRLRIQTHQLQQKMKANANEYDDYTSAFFRRRAKLLEEEGWSVDAFEALQERIMQAESALEMVADSAERRAELEQKLQTVEESPHMSEEEKAQLKAQFVKQDSLRWANQIEPTRRDWPAVRPYVDALEHLVNYVALNRPDPPNLDELPPPK